MTNEAKVPSWYANIWIAGEYAVAKQACREFCTTTALCVTVSQTSFVYVGGAEDGVCVRLMNYPRFPKEPEEMLKLARMLAEDLRYKLCQDSYSIETPRDTYWVSYRVQ